MPRSRRGAGRRALTPDFFQGFAQCVVPFAAQLLFPQLLHAGAELINDELRRPIEQLAGRTTPEQTLRRIDALSGCREAIVTNVAPLVALEATMVALFEGSASPFVRLASD